MSKKPKTELEVLLKAIAEGGNVDGITPNNDLNYWLKKIVENTGGDAPRVIEINSLTIEDDPLYEKVYDDNDEIYKGYIDLTKNGEYLITNRAGDTFGDLGVDRIVLTFGFIKGFEGGRYNSKPIVLSRDLWFNAAVNYDLAGTDDNGLECYLFGYALDDISEYPLLIKVTTNCVYISTCFDT